MKARICWRKCGFTISTGNCILECLLSRCDSQSQAMVAGQSYIPCAWRPSPHFGLLSNLFQRMKVFRRVATRYDKLDVTFLGFVHIAGTMKWLIWMPPE